MNYSQTATATALHAGILLWAASAAAGGAPANTPSGNLLLNGSMEYWHETGLTPQAWGVWRQAAHFHKIHAARDTAIKRDGRSSMRIRTQGMVNTYTGYPVKPGITYTLSAWIRAEEETQMLMKYSLGYTPEARQKGVKETPAGCSVRPVLPARQWTRVHLTATMPAGVNRATLYFCFPEKPNTYHFDMAMLNEGGLAPYQVGPAYEYITPFNRLPALDEVTGVAKSYGKADEDLHDHWVGYIFDRDPMSYSRLSKPDANLPKRLGVEFDRDVTFRGLSILFGAPGIPDKVEPSVSVLRNGAWQVVPHKLLPVGCVNLLQLGQTTAQGIRINLLPKGETPVLCPKIYMIAVAQ